MELFLIALSLISFYILGLFLSHLLNESEEDIEFLKDETKAPITDEDYRFSISFK